MVGWFANFGVAALRVPHDPPGFPAVQFLIASPIGLRVADDAGEPERQRWPGQHGDPGRNQVTVYRGICR
jgi:hypothetical protein